MNSELIFLVRLKLARQFDTYVALSVAVYVVFSLDNKIKWLFFYSRVVSCAHTCFLLCVSHGHGGFFFVGSWHLERFFLSSSRVVFFLFRCLGWLDTCSFEVNLKVSANVIRLFSWKPQICTQGPWWAHWKWACPSSCQFVKEGTNPQCWSLWTVSLECSLRSHDRSVSAATCEVEEAELSWYGRVY